MKIISFFNARALRISALALGLAAGIRAEELPRFEPLSPADSLRALHLPAGYRAEIVASEPLIQEPVWVAWDPNGVMYVAEMNSYMQDIKGTGTKTDRNGRIKRLTDTDGDSIMDQATVFVDGLLLPRMVLALDDRILISETGSTSIYQYRDTDGDGKADEKIVAYEGVPMELGVEHGDSALTWNIDNWIYTAQGGHRFRYKNGRLIAEQILEDLGNQWGMGMDDTGVMFHSQNSDPGRNFNQHWFYWNLVGERRAWRRFTRPTIGPETDPEFQTVYRVQHVPDKQTLEKTWTAACGLSIFRGDALGDEFYGNMFLAEPTAHAIRRAIVTREADGRRTLRNAYSNMEFFMSEDFYCRPVATATGPDGCLYVVDMYRGVVQDAPWVSEAYAQRAIAMGADKIKNRGRIYRISREGQTPPKPARLLEAATGELVQHLAHPNGWWRDTAQRLLVLRADLQVIPQLATMARTNSNPLARLHALWTMDGLGRIPAENLESALHDSDYRVRAAAIRLHEDRLRGPESDAVIEKLRPMATDPDPEVRRQLVLSLGWSIRPAAAELIAMIAGADPTNPIIRLAALTALYDRTDLDFIRAVQDNQAFPTLEPNVRTATLAAWQDGIQKWKGTGNITKPRRNVDLPLIENGARLYEASCMACHGADGRGGPLVGANTMAPPLDGSPRVVGPKELLVRILLHGLTGPIDQKNYALGIMAPLGATMSDESLAAVLTYIRQQWENDASAIRPEQVAEIRARQPSRPAPWTLADLKAYDLPRLEVRKDWKATAAVHLADNLIDGVVDGSREHAWYGANNPGCWFAVDLGAPTRLGQLVLVTTDPDWAPRGYKVEVSMDGITWSEPVALERDCAPRARTIASFEPVITRHVRVTQIGSAIERWLVSELELYGVRIDQPE